MAETKGIGVSGHRITLEGGTEFSRMKDPRLFPAMIAVAAFLLLAAMAAGAYIDRNRTPKEPQMRLYSPLAVLPEDQETVWVQYFWGQAHAIYFRGASGAPDVWMETYDLNENAATRCFSELYGLPFRWARLPEIPAGVKQSLIEDQFKRIGRLQ
jgi:hypothetical protein